MPTTLADCSDFNRLLHGRPARWVHITTGLLLLAIVAAVAWAEFTEVNLVVRGGGRVRPLSAPQKVYYAGRGEVLSASAGGRVLSVHYAEGQVVKAGDRLIRLDTGRLDNDIEQRRRAVATAEAELVRLESLRQLAVAQDRAARAKAEAELNVAERDVRDAEERRRLEVLRAEVDFQSATEEMARTTKLSGNAVSASEAAASRNRLAEATEKIQKAKLPVDAGRVRVSKDALALAERDGAVRLEEIALKIDTKRGEITTTKLMLAALELERQSADLLAPMDGVVISAPVKVGDLLTTGKPAVEIAEQGGFRFEATLPSSDVGELRPGMAVRLKLDAFDYQRFGAVDGTVESLSPDSVVPEGQQAPAYVVRVRLDREEIVRGAAVGRIKLGMTGQVEVVTGHEPLLELLVKKIRHGISLR